MTKKNKSLQVRRKKTKSVIRWSITAIIFISLFILLTEDDLYRMNTAKSSFLIFIAFIAVCACIYCGVLTFFSLISGWRTLALRFPAPETVSSDTAFFFSQSAEIGYMQYSSSVEVRFTETGLIFSQSPFFAFMHKPFIIPYEKTGSIRKLNSSGPDLEFTVEGVRIRMSGESAEALNKKKMNPSISLISLKPDNKDEGRSMHRGEKRLITEKTRFEKLQPAFISAVRDYIKSRNHDSLKDETSRCYETVYMEKGFLTGIVYHHYTDLVITGEWFFWGLCDGEGCSAGCAKFEDIAKTPDIERIIVSDHIEIRGINISGVHYDESRTDSWRINVGNDKEGELFRKELAESVKRYAPKAQ